MGEREAELGALDYYLRSRLVLFRIFRFDAVIYGPFIPMRNTSTDIPQK